MWAQPGVPIFVATATGIVLAECMHLALRTVCVVALLCMAVLGLCTRYRQGIFLAALACFVAAGAVSARAYAPPKILELPAAAVYRARVANPVNRQFGPQGAAQGTQLELLQVGRIHGWRDISGRLRVRLPLVPQVVRGDIIEVALAVAPLAEPRNPAEPKPLMLQRRYGLTHEGRATSPHALVAFGTGATARLDALRARLAASLERLLPEPTAAVAKALSLGDQSSITVLQRDAWADAGMAHLLAVSGLHVALVSALVMLTLRTLGGLWPRAKERVSVNAWAALATLPFTVGFCLLAGTPAAAVRATIMAVTAASGIALGRPARAANAWGLAGAGMLVHEPLLLFEAGFLLSFAAVGGLVFLPAPWSAVRYGEAEPKQATRRLIRRLLHGCATSLWASAVATVVTAPICAWFFGRVSLMAPWVNLVAVPLGSAVATPLALGTAWVGAFVPPLGPALAWLTHRVLTLLNILADKAASPRFATLDLPTPTPWEILAFALTCWAGYASIGPGARKLWFGAATLSSVVLATLIAGRVAATHGDGQLWVRSLYVGQGDATLITFPQGGVMLVDGGGAVRDGGPDPGRRVVAPWLRRLNIRHIDWMVLTHPHPDHLNGLLTIAEHWPVRHLLHNGQGTDFATVQRLESAVRRAGGTVRTTLPEPGSLEGVQVTYVHPTAGVDPSMGFNDNSIVLHLAYNERTFLLTGDVEQPAENSLESKVSKVDIFKVGHHGSRTSTTQAFLQKLEAAYAVISCGAFNRFGFPHQEVVQRLHAMQTKVLRTDLDGTITFRTDGGPWQIETSRAACGGSMEAPVTTASNQE